MKKLENKVVFITGGNSGIGYACAMIAAQEGAKVAVADIDADKGEAVVKELKANGAPDAVFVSCDVSLAKSVKEAIGKTVTALGGLDVGLNNAGIGGKPATIADMEPEDWMHVVNINLNGVFYCMKYELQHMIKSGKGGSIINMASILGHAGFANSSHYVAAKHGVVGLTQTAAWEYGTQRVRVNAICPGFIETPMLTNAGLSSYNEMGKMIASRHAMNRLGTAGEIASMFLWLASDDSSFANGASFVVDGGYLAQ